MALEGVRATRGNNGPALVDEEVCTPPGGRADEHLRWNCTLKDYCAAKIPDHVRSLVRVLSELGVTDVMAMLFERMPNRADWKEYSSLGYVCIRKVYEKGHMLFHGETGEASRQERKQYLYECGDWVNTDLDQGSYCMILGWLFRDAFKYAIGNNRGLPSIVRHFEKRSELNAEHLGDRLRSC